MIPMSGYDLTKTNLFINPESYFYSDCKKNNYFEEWIRSRKDYIERLKLDRTKSHVGLQSESIFDKATCSIEVIMEDIFRGLHDIGFRRVLGMKSLGKYIQKYEVSKRFYTSYSQEYVRNTDEIYSGYYAYIVFANCLIEAYSKKSSLQYVSTLLKICDAFTSVNISQYSNDEKDYLFKILYSEQKIISALYI